MSSRFGQLPSLGGGSSSVMRQAPLAPISASRNLVGNPLQSHNTQPGLQARKEQGSRFTSISGPPAFKDGRQSMLSRSKVPPPLAPVKGRGRPQQGGHMTPNRKQPPSGISFQSSVLHVHRDSNDDDSEVIMIGGPTQPRPMLHPLSTEDSSRATPSRGVQGLRGLREMRNSSPNLPSPPNTGRGASLMPVKSEVKPEKGKKKKNKSKKKAKKDGTLVMANAQKPVGQLQPLRPIQNAGSHAALTPIKSPAMAADIEFFKSIGSRKTTDQPGSPRSSTSVSIDGRRSLTPATPFQQPNLQPIGSPLSTSSLQVSSVDLQMLASPREPLSPNNRASTLQATVNSTVSPRNFQQRPPVPIEDIEIFTGPREKLAPVRAAAFMQTPLKAIGASQGQEHEMENLPSPRRGTLAPIAQNKPPTSVGMNSALGPISHRAQTSTLSEDSPIGQVKVNPVGNSRNIINAQSKSLEEKRPFGTGTQGGLGQGSLKRGPATNPIQSAQEVTSKSYQPPFKMGRRRQTSDFYDSTPEDTDEEDAIHDEMYAFAGSSPRQTSPHWESPTSYGTTRADIIQGNKSRTVPVNTQLAIVKRCSTTGSEGGTKVEFFRVLDEEVPGGDLCDDNTAALTPSSSRNTAKSKQKQHHPVDSSDESSKSFVFESPSTHHSYHTSDEDTDVYDSPTQEESEPEEIKGETYLDKLRKKLLKDSEDQDDKPQNTDLGRNAQSLKQAQQLDTSLEQPTKRDMYNAMVAAIAREIDEADNKNLNEQTKLAKEVDPNYTSGGSKDSFSKELTSEESTDTENMRSDAVNGAIPLQHNAKTSFTANNMSSTSNNKPETQNIGNLEKKDIAAKVMQTKPSMAEATNLKASTTSSGTQCFPTMLSRPMPQQKYTPAQQKIATGTKEPGFSPVSLQQSSANAKVPTANESNTEETLTKVQEAEITIGTSSTGSKCFPTMLSRATPLQKNTPAPQQPEIVRNGQTASISQDSSANVNAPSSKKVENSTKTDNAATSKDQLGTSSGSNCFPTMISRATPLQKNTPARQQIENGAKGLTPISISQSSGTGLPAKQPNTDGTVTKEGTATGSTVVASTAREPVNKGPFADGCYPNGGNAKQPSTTRSENNTTVSTANRPTTNGNIGNGNTIDRPAIKGSAAKSTLTTEVSLTPITNGPSVTGHVTTVKGPITKGPTAKLPIKKESMANGSMTNEGTAQGSITVGPATKGTVAKGQTTKGPTAKPANSQGMTLKDTVTSTAQEARNAPTKKQTISVTGELDSPSKTREDIKNRGNKQVNSNEKPAESHEDTSRRSQSLSNNTEAQISHTKEVEATKDHVESLKQRTTEQECNQTDGTDSEISIQETEDAETSLITSMIVEKTQSGECNTSIQSGDGNGNVTQHIRTSTSEKSHMSYTSCNSHTSSHHRSSHSGRTGHSHRRRSKESLTTNCRSVYSEGTRSSHCEDTCCNRSQHYCCRSRSGSSQLSRSGKSVYHSQRSRRSQNDCCRKHDDTNDWHRNTSGSALSDESQESSPRDSCTCMHCNQKRLRSRDCRSISGCNYSGASNKGWDDYESNRSTTYMSRSQQEKRGGECEMLPPEVKQTVGKHSRHTAKQARNRNCSDLDVNVSSSQQTISNGSDMTSAFSSDVAKSTDVQKRGSMTSKRIAANSGNSTDVSASSVKSETCPISPISFKSDMSGHRIRKNKRDVKNSHRSSNEKRKHTHRNLPERNYNQAVNDLRDRVPIKVSHNSTEADTKQAVKSRKSKAIGQLTPDYLYTATEEVPRDRQYITKQKSIECWLRESTQSVSFTKESASSIEPCPVSSQEGVTISNDSLSLMNVSDEQLHQTGEFEHQTGECESSCKQDETDIRDGAYSSNDANILKSSKDMKMALKLVKLGLIETTSDFEEYKHKLLMDEVQRREFSLKDAPSAKTEMISPQVIICPCSASHFQPQTRLPPHRCSRCYLMCSEPVTYGDKIEIPADKAKSSYTTNFDVPSRKVTEQVEEPIFRTKMFGLTGIPSEDKKVWQKFCRHILSGFSEDNKIGKLPGLTTPAFQSNMSSTSAAFMKPTVSTMVQNDTNHSLLHKAKPTDTEETLSTMTDSLSAINSEDVCAGHIQEIQAQNKKIQKLETQLEELRREMKLEQVQKESELVRIRSQRQYDREVFHRKLRQAKENAEVTHNSYQFAVDEEQEDLDIISLSVSDNETFNMGLESKSLRETVTQVSDPNQIERDTLYSSTKTFRRGFQVAQTDGRAKDSKNNEWNLKNEEISTFKSNGDKLQEMLEQHKQRLQDANTSKFSREDKFKGALIGQSESYAKISHLVIDDQSLQNDHLNETSTVEALTASLDILKRDNTELKSESEVKDKEIWELKKERLDLKDRVFQLDRELFDTQDKLIKKSAVITDLEKTKQFLDNKVIQLAEQQREHNIIMSRKNQLLIEGKRSGNDLREKIERLEDHLRFRCRINNNLRDDKVLLEKKLALLECQYDCAWNERDGSYNMMKRKLDTSSSERI